MRLIDYTTEFSAKPSDLVKSTDSNDFTDSADFTDFTDSYDSYNSNALCYFNESETKNTISNRFNLLKLLISLIHFNDEEKNDVETILCKYKNSFSFQETN